VSLFSSTGFELISKPRHQYFFALGFFQIRAHAFCPELASDLDLPTYT
jgi:hypothetical protein